jgi:phenylacetate-coenzyme A ligase PaaK-like adenylate-forming protein
VTTHAATSEQAVDALDQHLREIIAWHFSPKTGCPYWLDWAKQNRFDAIAEVTCFDDITKFPHFADDALRDLPHDVWVPRQYRGKPYCIFETGGTTGLPKQRISWRDHLTDYSQFSAQLDDDQFPRGGHWLMLGPTGPRRLRLTIEHLANERGGACYFVDVDPRFVKKMLAAGKVDVAKDYQQHVIEQAVEILTHRSVSCLFTTPRLLESLGERLDVPGVGIKGVFCGGTHMTRQVIRFLVEEVLDRRAQLVPTYGNTLMGLAIAKPVSAEDDYQLTYYAPQPRAVLRVVDPGDTAGTVDYGRWGRVELTTMTREFFMPRLLERDEGIRREPHARYPWDGVGDVRPFGYGTKKTIEGVY